MSFAAEPYGVFVDDLVSGLTGGVTRESFRNLVEQRPFRLGAGTAVVAATVRVHGLLDGEFHRFVPEQDFDVVDGTIVWREDPDGTPSAGATWPDRGTLFWASYERTPDPQAPPRLTDRNPGSIVRTLAESFAREFSVVSLQLDTVYRAAFIETAGGRDLDQLAALVGLTRRSQEFATGEVVFSRGSPAAADIAIVEGTLLSTADAPAVTVETTVDATLRAGTLSVAVPVRALVSGGAGIAPANSVTVVHRPILGITGATNPQPLAFSANETDDELRRRIARALQTGGRSTVDALLGAVTSVDGVREQDVLIEEDHLEFPGVVKMTIAADLDDDAARVAAERIEAHRPAGIRVLHDLPVVSTVTPDPGPGGGGGGDSTEETAPVAPDDIAANRFPIGVTAGLTPASSNLTAAEKETLVAAAETAIEDAVSAPGLGEPLIYNRLVADLMSIAGVYDAVVDVYQIGQPPRRSNVHPVPVTTRVELVELDVTLRGALVSLDVTADLNLLSFAAEGDPVAQRANAIKDIHERLAVLIPTLAPETPPGGEPPPFTVTPALLLGALTATETYEVTAIDYTAEFVDEGLRVSKPNVTITLQPDQVVSVRRVVDGGS
ncbi:MAG: baseplate J/gp47 family protein [Ilumatobacter sp.]|uniref:baseplate J/gp47 family protein n=1 Tax=Ilumatobacter sp. TaxID=1967498 RepID=UPI002606207D|nr:baseplate J/gp47 family protein [Ilumatobacter sp.]MDJ0768560.1 baseplate J/gp47 family protein [Ilumatobacter sp.]